MRSRPDQKPGRKGSTKIVWKFKWTYEIYMLGLITTISVNRTRLRSGQAKSSEAQKYMTGASSVSIKILIRKIIELPYTTSLNIVVTINVH